MPVSGTIGTLGRRGAVLVAIALLACATRPAPADDVYKSIDAQGHVVYSDHPDSPTAQKTPVRVDRPNPTDVARIVKEQEILKVEEIQRNRQKAIDDKKSAQQDHDKQVQCESARSHYYTMKDARRIFQRDADGNRIYYTDSEADAKREEARQAMQTACQT
jgi:hypothetical protein